MAAVLAAIVIASLHRRLLPDRLGSAPDANAPLPDPLQLETVGPQSRDHVEVRLHVTSPFERMGWDREFALLVWLVRMDGREIPQLQYGQSSSRDFLVREGPVKDVTRALLPSDRFMRLTRGQTLEKDFVLTSPFRCFEFYALANRYHSMAVPREGMYRYQFPPGARRVEIQGATPIWKGGDVLWENGVGFRKEFGVLPEELGLLELVSNSVTVELRD